ncbi:uncharacterized protein KY384_002980 [Bacidia gigantensis]|uniref:uncharacterized protein n=1 Tax=Bacidia gigantensis TaxID=2732470 RepID=UPI001D0461C9|nr:uncharacterized protein KY384_002980 [Bacidia gigantensis]KAG8531351.1 hypothetical protein KY384_002980 [Bacidia gigantensis]
MPHHKSVSQPTEAAAEESRDVLVYDCTNLNEKTVKVMKESDVYTESIVTTKNIEKNDRSNILLTNLYLDKLSDQDRKQRESGALSIIYVVDTPMSEEQSRT